MKSTYRLKTEGRVVTGRMSLTWCHGYLDRIEDEFPPRNPWSIVREADGKVIRELPAWEDVSVGQIAGHPTAGQYRMAAERAIRKAELIERREQKNEVRGF